LDKSIFNPGIRRRGSKKFLSDTGTTIPLDYSLKFINQRLGSSSVFFLVFGKMRHCYLAPQ
jgi:hypothetical protein